MYNSNYNLQSYVLTSKNLENTSNIKSVNTSIKQLLNGLQTADGKNMLKDKSQYY